MKTADGTYTISLLSVLMQTNIECSLEALVVAPQAEYPCIPRVEITEDGRQ